MNIHDFFASLPKKTYFQPLAGNHGDDLIVMGIEQLARQHKISFSSDLESAQHILIKGGGALLDVYPRLLNQLSEFFQKHVDTPTTFLPTSYMLHSTDMGKLVGTRSAPLHIFARETYSYDLLQQVKFDGPVTISMEHDTAFHLAGTPFIQNLKDTAEKEHVLIVERIDPEALNNQQAFVSNPSLSKKLENAFKKMFPSSSQRIKSVSRKVAQATSSAEKTRFARQAREQIYSDYPEFKDLPVKALDVSSAKCCDSMEEFSKMIGNSAAVFSSRLHVGILAAMLDIPTYVVEGVYHKIRGIYEYSMVDMPHVQLIPRSESVS